VAANKVTAVRAKLAFNHCQSLEPFFGVALFLQPCFRGGAQSRPAITD